MVYVGRVSRERRRELVLARSAGDYPGREALDTVAQVCGEFAVSNVCVEERPLTYLLQA